MPPALGAGQEAVHEVDLEVRLDQRHHEYHLVHVGHQHMLPPARGPRQNPVPRLDPHDHPIRRAVALLAFLLGHGLVPDPVAGGDDGALMGREAAQQPAHHATRLAARLVLHHAHVPMHAQHPPRQGRLRRRHGGLFAFLLRDGALARHLALGAHALALRRRLLGEAVLLEALGPLLVARAVVAVLAQLDADLLLLGHATAPPAGEARAIVHRSCSRKRQVLCGNRAGRQSLARTGDTPAWPKSLSRPRLGRTGTEGRVRHLVCWD